METSSCSSSTSIHGNYSRKQAESSRHKVKDEELDMDIWQRLPYELILEIFTYIIASSPFQSQKPAWHKNCISRCIHSSLSSKLAMKERYENGDIMGDDEFSVALDTTFACPIWGISHLEELQVGIILHHCQCSVPSPLHQILNSGLFPIKTLILLDLGQDSRGRINYPAKIVIKDFSKDMEISLPYDEESNSEDSAIPDCVSYWEQSLEDAFRNTCGEVVHCEGGIFGLTSSFEFEEYLDRGLEDDRLCCNCLMKRYNPRASREDLEPEPYLMFDSSDSEMIDSSDSE